MYLFWTCVSWWLFTDKLTLVLMFKDALTWPPSKLRAHCAFIIRIYLLCWALFLLSTTSKYLLIESYKRVYIDTYARRWIWIWQIQNAKVHTSVYIWTSSTTQKDKLCLKKCRSKQLFWDNYCIYADKQQRKGSSLWHWVRHSNVQPTFLKIVSFRFLLKNRIYSFLKQNSLSNQNVLFQVSKFWD